MKVIFTQDQKAFNELKVPYFNYKHGWFSSQYKFPFDMEFNHTYYKWENGGLTAFRILAYTFNDDDCKSTTLNFLVQLPNKPLQWIVDFINKDIMVFNSVEDYVLSGGVKSVDLHWCDWCNGVDSMYIHHSPFFKGDFWTIKDGAVIRANGAWCNRFVATEDGFFANIAKDSLAGGENGIYLDKMIAIKTLLKDMPITDFETETITIKMNVLDNTPKYTKIQFVD